MAEGEKPADDEVSASSTEPEQGSPSPSAEAPATPAEAAQPSPIDSAAEAAEVSTDTDVLPADLTPTRPPSPPTPATPIPPAPTTPPSAPAQLKEISDQVNDLTREIQRATERPWENVGGCSGTVSSASTNFEADDVSISRVTITDNPAGGFPAFILICS